MFQLLHEYFDFKIVREDETAMEEYEHSPSSCMIAQFPLSIVVRQCVARVVLRPGTWFGSEQPTLIWPR